MNPEQQRAPVQRKPASRARIGAHSPRLPLPAVRREIWEQACELVTAGRAHELVAVLANRFQFPQRTVVAVLMAEGMSHQRAAATLRNGISNVLMLARDAERITVEEIA